jgi:hypothetical protein
MSKMTHNMESVRPYRRLLIWPYRPYRPYRPCRPYRRLWPWRRVFQILHLTRGGGRGLLLPLLLLLLLCLHRCTMLLLLRWGSRPLQYRRPLYLQPLQPGHHTYACRTKLVLAIGGVKLS